MWDGAEKGVKRWAASSSGKTAPPVPGTDSLPPNHLKNGRLDGVTIVLRLSKCTGRANRGKREFLPSAAIAHAAQARVCFTARISFSGLGSRSVGTFLDNDLFVFFFLLPLQPQCFLFFAQLLASSFSPSIQFFVAFSLWHCIHRINVNSGTQKRVS